MAKTAACPSCGAPVVFRSVASVLAVCDYCQSTLVRHGAEEVLENRGRMAELMADRSPLQRGSEGRWKGRHFALIGRIQLRYDAGLWNEWHLLFDDGKGGWLSEAGGEYVISEPVRVPEELPAFAALAVGASVTLAARAYQVTNILNAECVAGEGELPFAVGGGYPAPLVDLRDAEGRFATLDYSDAELGASRPLVFLGEAVDLKSLACNNLRDLTAAGGAAPTVKAKVFQCPSCGAPLSARSADILSVGCASCGAVMTLQGKVANSATNSASTLATEALAKVVAKSSATQAVEPLIPLGATGTLRGEKLEVIGFMQRRMQAEGIWYFWREYVLVTPEGGQRWLTEYDGHWNLARVQGKVVGRTSGASVKLQNEEFKHFQSYSAQVDYVVGEFPWLVKLDESVQVRDYVAPPRMLSCEVDGRESVWTLAEYLAGEELQKAFQLPAPLPAPVGVYANQPNPARASQGKLFGHFWKFVLAAWVIHLALLLSGSSTLLKNYLLFQRAGTGAGATAVAAEEPQVAGEFRLPDGASRLEIAHRANVQNSWLALQLTLVNKDTGESWQAEREISYYAGVDDGESWSEGRPGDEIVFTDLPAGTYVLAEEAELDYRMPTVGTEVQVRRPGPRWSSLIVLMLVLTAFPAWSLYSRYRFEVARWAESDHPLVTTSDDDD